jgi:transposase-like protein
MVKAFLDRPLEGDWPCVWLDATYLKVRRNRIVSVAVILAVGVNMDGRREVLGMDIGPSEAETFWIEFLRKLRRRGLGVKLVISDAHQGIEAAVTKLMNATWQRCRVHTMPNALAYAGKSSRRVVSAFMATAFAKDSAEAAKARWRKIADQLRSKLPKFSTFMDEAEDDVLPYMSFPADHWPKIHSAPAFLKPVTDGEAIVRLVGAILLEQNEEWARTRYVTLATRRWKPWPV